jgi:hypothetical protein
VIASTRGYDKKIINEDIGQNIVAQSVIFWDYRVPEQMIHQIDVEYRYTLTDLGTCGISNHQQKLSFATVEVEALSKDEQGCDLSAFYLFLPQYVVIRWL